MKKIDTSIKPYFDTFNQTKQFHQVLYTPGRAVQTREVNEMQSIMQNQLEQFANNIFENGTKVIGGEINYDLNAKFITIEGADWSQLVDFVSSPDLTLRSEAREVTAKISHYTRDSNGEPITFYLKYTSGDVESNIFNVDENIVIFKDDGTHIATVKCTNNGEGSLVHVAEGYYYVNGYFLYTPEQNVILEKYSSEPTVSVGFDVVEEIVTSAEDSSLLDNANGTTNFNAPGADRLKIALNLIVTKEGEDYDKENFVQLAIFKEGVLQEIINRTEYNIIRDEAARRDFDAHGNYTVKPFNVFIREHDTDSSKYKIGVEAGKAYVKGYEIEKIVTNYLESSKARDTIGQTNSTMQLDVGAYIIVKDVKTIPDINTNQVIEFYDGVLSGANATGAKIGTGFIRQFRIVNNENRLYVFNLKNAAGKVDSSFMSKSKSMKTVGGTNIFVANNVDSIIYNTLKNGLIYKLANDNIKTLLKADGTNDTFMTVAREFKATSGTDSKVQITVSGNEIFSPIDDNALISYDGIVKKLNSMSVEYSPNLISVNVGAASKACVILLGVVKQTTITKSKVLVTETLTLNAPNGKNEFNLGKADVQSIKSVKQNNIDITYMFNLNDGTTSEYYSESKMLVKSGEKITDTNSLIVEFEYFQHTSGDYFSVDSYSTIDYSMIPEFNGIKLSDVLDFRPNIFTGTNFSDLPMSNTLTTSDVIAYLPRVDKVVLSSSGEFSVVNGVSSLNPIAPETPDNTMAIYTFNVPAYTESASDIEINYIDNKRYTMRDIGKIDSRLSTLEKAYTLTLLELETDSMQVLDAATGLNRYKNGFFVDNYTTHQNSRWADVGYKCSVSRTDGTLRPEVSMDAVDYAFNSTSSNAVKKTGDLITLDYTEIDYLNQMMASSWINVNPYAVLTWGGVINLSPSSDIWFDSKYTAPEVHYSVFNNGKLSQSWDSWQLNWTGTSPRTTTSTTNDSMTQRTSTTTTTSTSVSIVNDRVVDTNVVPYMRAKKITVKGEGFMPYSKLYAFFDNVDVTKQCGVSNYLTVDAKGEVSFTFNLPNSEKLKFRSGTKQFKLIDNINNNDSKAMTFGEVDFTSQGVIETRTQTINATRTINTTRRVQEQRMREGGGGGNDPVAQSFLVKDKGGVFITEVEVFFKSKDATKPVILQLREMENGFPTLTRVPYGEVILMPDSVQVSDNASKGTKFKFQSPVYLNEETEYCFVLLTNSLGYNVWKATMGEVQIDKREAISKQPFIGVMFKSQNNTTWTEDQMSDLKFNIKRAKFNTANVGKAIFDMQHPVDETLEENPLYMANGSKDVRVRIDNHGLMVDDKFTLDGIDFAYLPVDLFNAQHTVKSVINSDYVTFEISQTATVDGIFGGSNILTTKNIQASILQPLVQDMIFSNTNIEYKIEMLKGKSLSGNENAYTLTGLHSVTQNENNELMYPVVVPSIDNSKANNGYMQAELTSYWDNISPVIDINRVGLIAINSRINYPSDISDELTSTNGKSDARSISNIMQVEEPANSLKIIVDLCKPQDTDVVYYYRVGNSQEEVESKTWVKLDIQKGSTVTKVNEYKEFNFGKDDMDNFTFYQIKTVMLSKSSATIPSVRKFRCLALGT